MTMDNTSFAESQMRKILAEEMERQNLPTLASLFRDKVSKDAVLMTAFLEAMFRVQREAAAEAKLFARFEQVEQDAQLIEKMGKGSSLEIVFKGIAEHIRSQVR